MAKRNAGTPSQVDTLDTDAAAEAELLALEVAEAKAQALAAQVAAVGDMDPDALVSLVSDPATHDEVRAAAVARLREGFKAPTPTPTPSPAPAPKASKRGESAVASPVATVHAYMDNNPGVKRSDAIRALQAMGVAYYTARTQVQVWHSRQKNGGVTPSPRAKATQTAINEAVALAVAEALAAAGIAPAPTPTPTPEGVALLDRLREAERTARDTGEGVEAAELAYATAYATATPADVAAHIAR